MKRKAREDNKSLIAQLLAMDMPIDRHGCIVNKQKTQTTEQREQVLNGLYDPDLLEWGCGTFLKKEKGEENTSHKE